MKRTPSENKLIKLIVAFLALVAGLATSSIAAESLNGRDYGAAGDDKADDTVAFQTRWMPPAKRAAAS